MKKENSAGAVVFRKGTDIKYLVLHYEEGHWDFPKGHIEHGETEEETVKREVQEETGLTDLQFIKSFKEVMNYTFRLEMEAVSKNVVFFLAQTNSKNVTLSDEHIGYKWLPFEKAREKLTYNNARDVLEKAQKFLAKR